MSKPTLSERYVDAVVRRVPEKMRGDLATEVRASIASDIEARLADGQSPETAERDALVALGDPERLAASRAGTALHLIGPALYLDWKRLLTLLLTIVLPIVAGVLVVAQVLSGADPFELVLGVITTVVSVGIAMAFWVTVAFAIIERTGGGDRAMTSWSPDSLPASTVRSQVGIGDLVGGVLGLVLLVAGLVAQSVFSPIRDDNGMPIAILAPELWTWWIPFLLAIVVIELAFAIVLYRRRAWSWALATINIVVNVAVAVPLIVLVLTDSVINPLFSAQLIEFAEVIEFGPQIAVVAAVAIGAVSLLDSFDGARKAAQASR